MEYRGIRAKWLMVDARQVREDHGLIWDDRGVIQEIVPNAQLEGRRDIIDAAGQIVCPGFINTHMHMYSVLVPFGLPVKESEFIPYLERFWWPQVEDRLDHDTIRAVTEFACIDLPAGGYTAVNDTLEAPYSLPGCLTVEQKCLEASGLRAWLTFEATERVSRENGQAGLEENARFVRESGNTGRIQGMMCVHTSFSCSPEFLQKADALAKELGCHWQAHLSEDVDESQYTLEKYGKRPVELYDSLGLLSRRLLLSQCVAVDDREMDLLARCGVGVSHQPASNALAGHGAAPVADMLARGIPVGLGTDGGRSDGFELMRVATMAQRIQRGTAGVMSPEDVFHMATAGGAAALGRSDLGRLDAGCRADLLVLDNDIPTNTTAQNMAAQLVNYGKKEDIHSVVVDGEFVVRQRKNLRFDEAAVKRTLREVSHEFWKEAD